MIECLQYSIIANCVCNVIEEQTIWGANGLPYLAVCAGFKKAWQERDYATIITVARKIPDKILQEDPKLLMWYDQAVTRSEEDT